MLDLDHLKTFLSQTTKLSSEWYIGALTAAGTAAAVVPAGERLVAAVLAGGVVVALGAYKTMPCCASCAAGAGCSGTAAAASSGPQSPAPRPAPLMSDVGFDPAAVFRIGGTAIGNLPIGALPRSPDVMPGACS